MMRKLGSKRGAAQPEIYTFPAPPYWQFGHTYLLESLSPLIGQVFKKMGKVLDSQAPLLFQGEPGTGKEVFAHLVHGAGPRCQGRFVVVECQAPSEAQLEKELWGPRNGTGATADDWGKLGEAENGTIFLKNVDTLTPGLQLRILQMLQEKMICHPETQAVRKISVRVIASTKKNLALEFAAGRFCQDLFYRLTVHQCDLPPLRDRKEDVPQFVNHFVYKFIVDTGGERCSFTPSALSLLKAHAWPGNIRELRQVILLSIVQMGEGASFVDRIHWAETNGNGGLPHEIAHALEQPGAENLIAKTQKHALERTTVP